MQCPEKESMKEFSSGLGGSPCLTRSPRVARALSEGDTQMVNHRWGPGTSQPERTGGGLQACKCAGVREERGVVGAGRGGNQGPHLPVGVKGS